MASIIKADTLQSTTANVFVLNSSGTEYARFDSDGDLGIGTTTPNAKLHVVGNSHITGNVGIGTTNPLAKLNVVDGSTGCNLYIGYSGGGGTNYLQSDVSTYFTNSTGATFHATINPYGIGVGSATPTSGFGIAFPATQSASSDANTLDDYEEGTFTPTIVATTTNPTVSYGRQDGRYVKIGMLVYATGSIVVNSISGGSGNLAFGGFPFTSRNTNEADRTAINISYVSGFSSTTIPTSGIFNAGQTYAEMLVFNSADARGGRTSYIGSPPAAGFNIYYTTCYCTNT
jgi:hypothetical protein